MRLPDNGRYSHPKVRPSTVRFWALDEHQPGEALCLVSGEVLDDSAGGIDLAPAVIPGPTGHASRFSGLNQALWGTAPPSDDALAVALGDWTASVLVRLRDTLPLAGTVSLFGLTGLSGDGDGAQNFIFRVAVNSAGAPQMFWESGTGVTQETRAATDFRLEPYEWNLVTFRKRNTTGVGPAGICDLDLLINGVQVETWSAVPCASGGASALFRIGADSSGGGVPQAEGNVDIAGCYFDEGGLSDDELIEDSRRIRALSFHMRVEGRVDIQNQDGHLVDVTRYNEVDFVDEVKVHDDVDTATKTADIRLLREVGNLSLATLKTDSPINLLDVFDPTSFFNFVGLFRLVEVWTARVPLGLRAGASDWFSYFLGVVDSVKEGEEDILLSCRDLGAVLIETMIERVLEYGDPGGVPVEGQMQQILDDNDNDPTNDQEVQPYDRDGAYDPIELDVQESPLYDILDYEQRREAILNALRQLASLTAWDCKYRYIQDPMAPGHRLSFFEPRRERGVIGDVDAVILEEDILRVNSQERSIHGRRTSVRVVYPSSETTLPVVPTPPTGYEVEDSGWVNVDGEGQRMMAFVQIKSTAALAVLNLRQFMELAEASTSQIDTIDEAFDMCLGALQDLDEVELGKRIAMPAMPEAEVGDMLRFGRDRVLHTAALRLAVKSFDTVIGETSETSAEFRGKPAAGFKRWLRLETRNGRAGAVDPFETLSDQQITSLLSAQKSLLERTSLFSGGKYLAVRNPDFQGWSDGVENPPDGWTPAGGAAWNTDMTEEVSVLAAGGHAVRFLSDTGFLISDRIPVDGIKDAPYTVELRYQQPAGGPDTSFIVRIRWYDENDVELLSGDGRSAHKASSPAVISSLQRAANVATVTTSAAHGYATGDMVSVRPGGVTPSNQDFRAEKVLITVTGATTFTYANAGVNIGPLGDVSGIDNVSGTVVKREREETTPVPPVAGQWVTSRIEALEPPEIVGLGRFVRIEIERSGPSEAVLDYCTAYHTARETRLAQRSVVGTVVTGGSWRAARLMGDNPRFEGFDYGRNWYAQPLSGSGNPLGMIYYRARERQRVRVFCRLAFFETGANTFEPGRLRVVKNEVYDVLLAPTGVGTVVINGGLFQPGPGADIGTNDIVLQVEGTVDLDEGDIINIEHWVQKGGGGATIFMHGTNAAENFFIVKQESLD